jgi:fibronectin type 3 domain-containing protein
VDLAWTPVAGAAGYKIYRDGNQIGTSTASSYQDPVMNSGVTYTYSIAAYDQAGNTSSPSTTVTAIPRRCVYVPDNPPPSRPPSRN